MPAAMFRSVRRSTCCCNSSAISASRLFFRKSPNKRVNHARSRGIKLSSRKNEVDSLRDARPMLLFGQELFSPRGCQFVIARLAIVIGNAPLGFDPALRFQAIERGIERALLDV